MACPHDVATEPCVEALMADEAGEVVPAQPRRVRGKAVAAAVILGLVSTAAVLGTRPSFGSKLAEASSQDLQALWGNYDDAYQQPGYSQPDNGFSRPGYGGHGNSQTGGLWPQEDGKVPCGGQAECTCEWSNPEFCSRRDNPPTQCWSCCCEERHPEEYQRAVSQGGDSHRGGGYRPGGGESGFSAFHPGQHVRVLMRSGLWETASILRQAGPQQYELRLAHSGRIEYAPEERIAHDGGWWPDCWTLFWGILMCCFIGICATAVALAVKQSKE